MAWVGWDFKDHLVLNSLPLVIYQCRRDYLIENIQPGQQINYAKQTENKRSSLIKKQLSDVNEKKNLNRLKTD